MKNKIYEPEMASPMAEGAAASTGEASPDANGDAEADAPEESGAAPASTREAPKIETLDIADVEDSPYDPRVQQNSEADKELAASIKQHGVLQPVLVRAIITGYELIGGHRRKRAALAAGLTAIPCIVLRGLTNSEAAELAIIDNVQRLEINLFDEAQAYARLKNEFGYKVEKIARRCNRSKNSVYDALAVMELPKAVLIAVERGDLSFSHGVSLSRANGGDDKDEEGLSMAIVFADRALEDNWSSHALDAEIRQWREQRDAARAAAEAAASPPLPLQGDEDSGENEGASTREESESEAAAEVTAAEVTPEPGAEPSTSEENASDGHEAAAADKAPESAPETAKKPAETKAAAPPAKTPSPAVAKVPDGMVQTYVPKDDCFFCQDAGLTMQDVFSMTRKLIEIGQPKGLEPADVLATIESQFAE